MPKLHQSRSSSHWFLLLLWSLNENCPYLSTNIPACTACTMLLNRGFSSLRLSIIPICRVKVEASQSRTSEGTASDWMSLSSSSVSRSRLNTRNITRTLRGHLKFELPVQSRCSFSPPHLRTQVPRHQIQMATKNTAPFGEGLWKLAICLSGMSLPQLLF